MQYSKASIACPCGNPLFELGEPHSFLAVKLFVADSDKTPEPREGVPKKRLSLLTVCAAVSQMWKDLTERRGGGQVGAMCLRGRNDVLLREGKWRESTMFSERKQVYERKELSLESPVFIYTIQQWQLGLRLIFIWKSVQWSHRGSVLSHTHIRWLCPLHSWMFRLSSTLANNDKITADFLLVFNPSCLKSSSVSSEYDGMCRTNLGLYPF